MNWLLLAALAALTSGLSIVLQKRGTAANAVYHVSALNSIAMSVTMLVALLVDGSWAQFGDMTARCWAFTVAEGVVQAASWVTYFLALRDAEVSLMVALDKANLIVTMILARFLLGEQLTLWMWPATVLIIAGNLLMTGGTGAAPADAGSGTVPAQGQKKKYIWVFWGILSPSLQALCNVMTKMDTTPVSTSLTTFVRTCIVTLVLVALALALEGNHPLVKTAGKKCAGFIALSGVSLGLSYLWMYQAIAVGSAIVVTGIVKANMLVAVLLAGVFLKERLRAKGLLGFACVCAGVALFTV